MNFEELSKKFKKLGKDTVTEVQKLNEIRQLNGRINEEKKALNAIYMEMGKKLYELYKEAPLEGFEAEMQSVEEKFSMIDLLQDQARAVKGVALCPNCNTEIGITERFCSNCGGKMPEVIELEEKEEVQASVLEEAAEAAEEIVEEAADIVEDAAEEVGDAAEEAAEEIADAAEEVSEVIEDAAEEVSEVIEDAAEEASEVIEEAAEEAAETAEADTEE